jgi:hypothetical protein
MPRVHPEERRFACKLDAYYINHVPIRIAYITVLNLRYHRLGSPTYHHLFIYIVL